jgi:hypothetical protein
MPDTALPHDAAHPVLLLPVRLETRFVEDELRVRVHPDQVHVCTHEPGVTVTEEAAGHRYWEALWRSAGTPAADLTAWEALCQALLPARAAWVARATQPTNPEHRPAAPVPAHTALDPPPAFPPVTLVDEVWNRPAHARALPDRWRVVAVRGGDRPDRAEALSAPVRTPLVLGPPTELDPDRLALGEPPTDPHTRWLVDYDDARDAGMAITLPLADHPRLLQRVDRLLVYGVSEDPDPDAAAQHLAALLEGHHHTDGFAYLTPGTPTNQTGTAAPVPGRRSPEWAAALRVTHDDDIPPAESDAAQLAGALGVALSGASSLPGPVDVPGGADAPNALARAPGAAWAQERHARDMNTLLWPATWGGYLWQHLHPVADREAIAGAREHFLGHVRAAGPLPAVRVADQPYGVLPVAAPDDPTTAAPAGGLPPAATALMRRLRRDVWEPATADLPHVAGSGADPQDTVLRILAMAPTTQHVVGRSILGSEYFAYLWRFADLDLDQDWRTRLRDAADALRSRLGTAAFDPRIGRSLFSSSSFPVDAPTVSTPMGPGPTAYLADLASGSATTLRETPTTAPAGQTPLLYRLARQAVLTEYAMTASRILDDGPTPPPPEEHLDPELVGIVPGRSDVTLWQRLSRPMTTPGDVTTTVGDYLADPDPSDPAVSDLLELRGALLRLAQLPPEVLERLLLETLPLASHRLDAWITSLATARLSELRADPATRSGVHLAAYGWVEDLRPRPAPEPVDPPPDGEQRPVTRQRDNAGYVHAPSVAQATTAAVLRAGHRAHDTGAGGPLAVSLPSRRVRLAAWLLDGVRQGQPLGTLLGYRFERAVQEHPVGDLAAWIDDFRRVAPVRGTRVSADEPPREALVTTDVVDGLALQRLWRSGRLDLAALGLGPDQPAERQAAVEVLRDLDDAVDAVGDALLANAVHHAVQGHPERAAATLDAATTGTSPHPELEVVRTPRTGIAVTHRLLLAVPEPAAAPPEWPVDPDSQVRAAAEPRLNALLAALLPQPRRVVFRVRVDGRDGTVLHRLLDLTGLRLSPLDYAQLPATGQQDQPSALQQHLEAMVRARPDVPDDADLAFDHRRDPRWELDLVTVPEFLEALACARALLAGARALEPRDLQPPDAPETPAGDDPDLAGRAAAAVAALTEAAAALDDPARLDEGLRRAGALGVPFTVQPAGTAPEPQQTALAAAEVARRAAQVAAVPEHPDGTPRHVAVLRAVLGEGFPVVPSFDPPAATGLATPHTLELQGGDPGAATTWLLRAARVRPGAARLLAALSAAEALNAGARLDLRVHQLPHAPGDRWLGLPLTPSSPAGSRVSLVVQGLPDAGPDRTAGLVVDEWTEVIPHREEATAVAYHFDSPGAAPPQALILGLAPPGHSTWSTDLLEGVLHEALELARLRLVDLEALHPLDPDALTDIGQFLPAALYARNLAGDVVSTDFTEGR